MMDPHEPLNDAIAKLKTINTSDITLRQIKFNQIQKKKFNSLLDALKHCITLETITIADCSFAIPKKSKKMESLLTVLAEHPNIGWLFFTNNNIGDVGAMSIAKKISEPGKFQSLVCITLSGNNISKDGIQLFCDAILKCPTLKFLSFDKVEPEIENKLKTNVERIINFHKDALNMENEKFKKTLEIYPSLVNSRDNSSKYTLAILSQLAKNPSEFYQKRFEEIQSKSISHEWRCENSIHACCSTKRDNFK